MSKQIKAMKLALEALENSRPINQNSVLPHNKHVAAAAALREALADQPAQQEPVAWLYPEGLKALQDGKCWTAYPTKHEDCIIPLYTTPQAQPARESLTPAQKIALAEDWFAEDWAITKAVGMMVEYEMRIAHSITKKTP